MLNAMKKKIRNRLIKNCVVAAYEIEGIEYKIIDRKSPLPKVKNMRQLSFEREGKLYAYSAIYLNPKYRFQPVYPVPQILIELWANSNKLQSALVLGCCGCSVPRYIALSYPNAKITGVELSGNFIEIARKYFLLGQIKKQFTLIEGDAIEFVENKALTNQDVIYVDLFAGEKILNEVFSNQFLRAVYEITNENSIVIINAFGEDLDSLKEFCACTKVPFKKKYILKKDNTYFVCLAKGTAAKAGEFESRLMNCKDFTVEL